MTSRSTNPRCTADRRSHDAQSRRRPPTAVRRPGLWLGVAAAGAVLVDVLVGGNPTVEAEPGPVSVAEQLGTASRSGPAERSADGSAAGAPDLRLLEQLAASRATREVAQTEAAQVQASADETQVQRQQAEADARAAAEEAEQRASDAAAGEVADVAAATAERTDDDRAAGRPDGDAPTPSTVAAAVARISNTAGGLQAPAQAAADAVVSDVPGTQGITIGGTRASAADPGGHPSGLALDYMVGSDDALGDAITQYQIDNWAALGVEYVIWEQRMLSSPTGSWKPMADRGGVTANHLDHVHVNYLG